MPSLTVDGMTPGQRYGVWLKEGSGWAPVESVFVDEFEGMFLKDKQPGKKAHLFVNFVLQGAVWVHLIRHIEPAGGE